MPQFPEIGRTYELREKADTGLEYDLHVCLNCGNSRRDEDCIIRVQIACAENGWNRGWCRQQRDSGQIIETPTVQGE